MNLNAMSYLPSLTVAEPTTITPEVRNELIVTILGDLRPDVGGAIWRSWKPESESVSFLLFHLRQG